MQKNIFHIHTYICKHSSNKVDEIIKYALKNGYKKLYFTEHAPVSVKCVYQQRRAPYYQIAKLKKEIIKANKKYKGVLQLYFGYEVEFNKANRWYIQRLARDPYCDFLIFGNHFLGDLFKMDFPLPLVMNYAKTRKNLDEVYDNNRCGISSGLMSWMAHPEIFLNAYRKWDKQSIRVCNEIINDALKNHLPLAFNVNYPADKPKDKWHYPVDHFWKLVSKTNIPVIIESDAHDMHPLQKEWLANARKMALSYGLKNNLVDDIKLNLLPKKPLLCLVDKSISSKLNLKNVKDKIKVIEIDKNNNLLRIISREHIAPAWTILISNNTNLISKGKKLGLFLVGKQNCDMSISKFNKSKFTDIRKSFIAEA